jgi:hypothetical protein
VADFATQSERGFFLFVCCDHSNHGKWDLVFNDVAIHLSGALANVVGLVLDRIIEYLLEGGIELSESSVLAGPCLSTKFADNCCIVSAQGEFLVLTG